MNSLKSYGAAEEVTGSKHLLNINGKKYLIDCGIFQAKDAEKKNKEFKLPKDIEAIFLTHAHADHCALLPKVIKEGYRNNIYSTPATRDLSSVVMLDSAKLQQNSKEPIYNEKDCLETMNHFRCAVYGKEKKIDDLKFTFYDAGHILGSSMIDISYPTNFIGKIFGKKEHHILFTGDIGREDNPICNSPATNFPAPEYIVMESTYGNRTHEKVDTVYQELTYIINRTIERGGKILIPSFAIERAQELIYFIKVLMNEEKIPRIPVYVDSPMAINAMGVFNIHAECFNDKIKEEFISKGKNPFSTRTLSFINDLKESTKISKNKKPCIIISCNGMMEGGRILNHLKHNIENPNNTILIVGYMAENTLGRKVLQKAPEIQIDNEKYLLKCEVQKINALSAHGDYKEMLNWLKKIDTSKLKKIFLVHGEKDSQKYFSQYLTENGFNVQIVKKGGEYKL